MPTENIAYHFTSSTLSDGRPIPPIGETLRLEGKLQLCHHGYHWSKSPLAALQFLPGSILHKIRYGGEILQGPDKSCSSERTILASFEASGLLHRFMADQALSVAHLWPMSDDVRIYLTTLDKNLKKIKKLEVISFDAEKQPSTLGNIASNIAAAAVQFKCGDRPPIWSVVNAIKYILTNESAITTWKQTVKLHSMTYEEWDVAQTNNKNAIAHLVWQSIEQDFNSRVFTRFDQLEQETLQ